MSYKRLFEGAEITLQQHLEETMQDMTVFVELASDVEFMQEQTAPMATQRFLSGIYRLQDTINQIIILADCARAVPRGQGLTIPFRRAQQHVLNTLKMTRVQVNSAARFVVGSGSIETVRFIEDEETL